MLRDLFSLFPACAGVILVDKIYHAVVKAFPRMCGGDPITGNRNRTGGGFSPHVRG